MFIKYHILLVGKKSSQAKKIETKFSKGSLKSCFDHFNHLKWLKIPLQVQCNMNDTLTTLCVHRILLILSFSVKSTLVVDHVAMHM